jgi:hypothetical protein
MQIILIHKRSLQDKILLARVSMFQTVCSDPLHHQMMVVRCISHQRRICLLSQYGGALYFISSQSALNKVCGFDCYSTYSYNPHYHFGQIQVNDAISNKNYVNYSSIVRCVSEETYPWYILRLLYGKICCTSINVSLNKCYGRTIGCYPFTDSSSAICSFSHSSFTDNTLTGYTVFFLWNTGSKYEIKSCNIIRNTQPLGNGEGTIYTYGNTIIEGSCILENNANCIFYQSSSYTITISNCTVDSTSKYGTVITQNTVTKSFILALNHISTQNCHSKYDSAGYLTPIIETPSSSKKQIDCYTCRNFFYQSQVRDFVSLLRVFLFGFIHLNSSNYALY